MSEQQEYTADQLALQSAFIEATAPSKPTFPVWETGIALGMPAEQYYVRELGVASKSGLDQVARSPAHYRAWIDGVERTETPALHFGKGLHTALLEPLRFAEIYAVEPYFGDCRNKGPKANRDAWRAENAGKIFISTEDERAILGMLESVMRHPAASQLILDGVPEVTIRWIDEITGLRCKSRADYWVKNKRLAVDIKTTEDASEDNFGKSAAKYRYHVQDALYRAGFDACDETIDYFAILAIEKAPPFAVAVYELDTDAVTKGFNAARRDLARLAVSLETNTWPAYGDGMPRPLSLPKWAA